ncbi:MAG: cation:proton antiporter [Thermoplasmata archaeon]|nr:cation:proton antiporter [Thermoplasmata archaeon]
MDISRFLLDILLLIFIGRSLGLLFVRFKFQSLIGEVLGGLILSSLVLGLVRPNETLMLFSQFGIIVLMLLSGLLTDFRSFQEYKTSSIVVGILGVLFSMSFIFLTLWVMGIDLQSSLFISVVLSNTAVEVCATILLKSNASKKIHAIIMGASFVDDIIAVFLIGVVGSLTLGEEVSIWSISFLSVKVILFIVITLLLIPYIFEKVSVVDKLIGSGPQREKVLLTFTVLFAILMAIAAMYSGLQVVIGAYIGGLIVGKWGSKVGPMLKRRIAYEELIDDISSYSHALFTPLFFGYVGIVLGEVMSNLGFDTSLIYLIIILTIMALLGKFLGCGLGAKIFHLDNRAAGYVGIAMGGRGALEMVLLTLGYEKGIISASLFASVVIVTLLTVILTPILFSLYERKFMASP